MVCRVGEVLRLQEALLSDAGSTASALPRVPDVHPSLRAPSVEIRLRLQLPHGPYCREAHGAVGEQQLHHQKR
jgi:hypothetical protein